MRLNILYCLSFFCSIATAQPDTAFLKHLTAQNLQREHFIYLRSFESGTGNNELASEWTRYFLKYKLPDTLVPLVKDHFLQLRDNPELQQRAAGMLLHDETWVLQQSKLPQNPLLSKLFMAITDPKQVPVDSLPVELHEGFTSYSRALTKSAVAAGVFSALLPGAGKIYAGRKRMFLPNLLSVAIYGTMAYEAVSEKGISNPLSVLTLSAAGLIYSSIIYGSVSTVKAVRTERKRKFVSDAENYLLHSSPSH